MWKRLAGHDKPGGARKKELKRRESPSNMIMRSLIQDHADILSEDEPDGTTFGKVRQLETVLTKADRRNPYEVKYERKVYDGVHLGRFYGSIGLGQSDKRIVSTLLSDSHMEVDIYNTNPSLVVQIFDSLDLPAITHYVDNRDDIFAQLVRDVGVDESVLKRNFLGILAHGKPIDSFSGYGGMGDPATKDAFKRHEFVRRYFLDVAKVHAKVAEDYKWLSELRGKTESALSLLLGDVESSILEIVDRFIESRYKNEFVVYKFDGYVVPNSVVYPLFDFIVPAVKNELGLDISVSVKQLGPRFALSIPDEELADNSAYAAWKHEFEKNHFYVKGINKYVRISPYDGSLGDPMGEADFKSNNHTEPEGFIRDWIKDPTHRVYEKMDLKPPPLTCPDHVYNRYHGLEIHSSDPVPDNDVDALVERFLTVIDVLTGGGRGVSFEWVLDWMAMTVVHPGVNPGVVPCFLSRQGMGKNFIFTKLLEGRIIGKQYCESIASVKQLFTQSGALHWTSSGKLMTCIDEAKKCDNSKYEDTLKSLITSQNFRVKVLYSNEYEAAMVTSFVMFSNRYDSMPSGRRFALFSADAVYQYPDGFWKAAHAALDDGVSPRAFYQFLERRDVSVEGLLKIPDTQIGRNTANSTSSYFDIWIQDYIITANNTDIEQGTAKMYRDSYNNFVHARNMPRLAKDTNGDFKNAIEEFAGKVSGGYKPKTFRSGNRTIVEISRPFEVVTLHRQDHCRIDKEWIAKFFDLQMENNGAMAPGFIAGRP
jgi:hypothetical protein